MQYSNELYHYGVLGMRWGVHRYHNRYGEINKAGRVKAKELETEHDRLSKSNTLTKRGQKHLSDMAKQYKDLTGKDIRERLNSAQLKKIHEMTNDELQAYTTRKQLENQYNGVQSKNNPVAIPYHKKIQDMTNEELQAYNTRKQLESQYLSYQPKPTISKGRKFITSVGTKVIAPVAIEFGKAYLKDALKNIKMTSNTAKAVEKEAKEAAKAAAEAAAKAALK